MKNKAEAAFDTSSFFIALPLTQKMKEKDLYFKKRDVPLRPRYLRTFVPRMTIKNVH
jgi:hypothetical protein